MSYRRIETQDGKTVMNKELYDNLQDGIEEALEKGSVTTECTTIEEFVLTEEATTIKKGVTVLIGEVQYILVTEDGTNANNYIAVGATPDNIVLSEDYADPEVAQEEFNGFPEREDVIGNYEATITSLREQNQLLRDNMCNPNLLDNPWFTVNQRGQNEYTEYNTYCVDRWKQDVNIAGTIKCEVLDNGLNLSAISECNLFLNQLLRINLEDNKIYTFSILTGDGKIYSVTGNINSVYDCGDFLITFETNKVSIVVYTGKTLNIRAAKLECGSISTLHMDVEPNYDIELYKCCTSTIDPTDEYANKDDYATLNGNLVALEDKFPKNFKSYQGLFTEKTKTITIPRYASAYLITTSHQSNIKAQGAWLVFGSDINMDNSTVVSLVNDTSMSLSYSAGVITITNNSTSSTIQYSILQLYNLGGYIA